MKNSVFPYLKDIYRIPPQIVDTRAPGGRWVRPIGTQRRQSPFSLPGVKKRRLFEDIFARSSCALDRQGANGPPTVPGRTHRPPGAASCHFHASVCPLRHVGYMKYSVNTGSISYKNKVKIQLKPWYNSHEADPL